MALPSAGARFYYHYLDMSPYLDGVDPTFSRDLAEHKPLGNNPIRLSAGHKKCTISLTGVYDGAQGGAAEAVWNAFNDGETHPFTHLPAGDSFAGLAYCGLADISSEQVTAGEGFVKFPVAVVASQTVDRCLVLAPLAQRGVSGLGSSYDHGAATNNGGTGYLHCTQLGLGATLTVRVQHSSDGAVWEDLITFDALAPGSAAMEVTGEVRSKTRVQWTLSGGNATFFVAFGRR